MRGGATLLRGLVAMLVAAVAVGCAADVETAGGSGSGGASSGASTGASKETSSTHASTSTGVDPSVSTSFCGAVGDLCFDNCHLACEDLLVDPCAAEGEAYVKCMTTGWNASACEATGCDDAHAACATCRAKTHPVCLPGGGGGFQAPPNDAQCSYLSYCNSGQEKTICDISATAMTCNCYLDATLLGSCTFDGAVPFNNGPDVFIACSPETGCCNAVFGTKAAP